MLWFYEWDLSKAKLLLQRQPRQRMSSGHPSEPSLYSSLVLNPILPARSQGILCLLSAVLQRGGLDVPRPTRVEFQTHTGTELPSGALQALVPVLLRAAGPSTALLLPKPGRCELHLSQQGLAGELEPSQAFLWPLQWQGTVGPGSSAQAEWPQATSLLLSPATCWPWHSSSPLPGAGTGPAHTSWSSSGQLQGSPGPSSASPALHGQLKCS